MSQNETKARTTKPTLILIHGAWQGAWAWGLLLPQLRLHGYSAIAVDLPGNGHHPMPVEDVTPTRVIDHVKNIAEHIDGDIVLVGHSGGGMVATAVAEALAHRVSHVIYIAGMLLPNGETFDDIQQQIGGNKGTIGVTPHIVTSPDGLTTTVPINAAIEHFYNDCPPQQAMDAAKKLTPQAIAGARFKTPTTERFAQLPKLYIHALADNSILPAAQTLMQQNIACLDIIHINTAHAPQLSQPKKLASIIANYLAQTAAI